MTISLPGTSALMRPFLLIIALLVGTDTWTVSAQ